MKHLSKALAVALAGAMTVASFTACGGSTASSSSSAAGSSSGASGSTSASSSASTDTTSTANPANKADDTSSAAENWQFDAKTYATNSATIYDSILGDFNDLYTEAVDEQNQSKSWAEMAVAEAKLLESGVFIPLSSHGGAYRIGRNAPYTVSTVLWGSDMYRTHNAISTTDLIKKEDYTALKEYWNEHHGDGSYDEYVKKYLKDKGYTLKDTRTEEYTSDPVTWDAGNTSRQADSDAIIMTYDGLYEYDDENVEQPALAESYEVSDDGLTYTFHLRKGVKWVDSQGREVADVKADDFVAGMEHVCDAQGGLEYLLGSGGAHIVNADSYVSGDITDFSQVGVKAVDDYTLQYTLDTPTSYFMSMLGYGVFAPLSRDYYQSQGGKFGEDFDPEAEDYKYGTDPDHIAYCGPYLVTNATEKNKIVFEQNPSYWNKDKVNNKTVTWIYNDGTDAMKAYNDCVAGDCDGVSLNTSSIESAKSDGNFDKYATVSDTDATTFNAFLNVYRNKFANASDAKKAVSEQTVGDAVLTNAALQNLHFRRAIVTSLDRASYNAQTQGEDCKLNNIRNSYTPGNFVSLTEDTTVSINGTDTEFKAGTNFGEIVQATLDADGVKITAYDKSANDGAGSSDGFDGWYNPDYAKSEMETAIKELGDAGTTIDSDHKVQLDLPYLANDETYKNKANVFKQSIENVLGDYVQVNLVACDTAEDWYNAGYQCSAGSDMNYNIYDASGWGPDYGDPRSYLGTMLPEGNGYMTKCLGIY